MTFVHSSLRYTYAQWDKVATYVYTLYGSYMYIISSFMSTFVHTERGRAWKEGSNLYVSLTVLSCSHDSWVCMLVELWPATVLGRISYWEEAAGGGGRGVWKRGLGYFLKQPVSGNT